MNDKKLAAIKLTAIGLDAYQEYAYSKDNRTVSAYSIVSVDGSSFFVTLSTNHQLVVKKEFDNAGMAAHVFATSAWKLMGI